MTNRTLLILGALAVLVILVAAWNAYRTPVPVVQISTDAAKVSIGAGGVSISVAPSQP